MGAPLAELIMTVFRGSFELNERFMEGCGLHGIHLEDIYVKLKAMQRLEIGGSPSLIADAVLIG